MLNDEELRLVAQAGGSESSMKGHWSFGMQYHPVNGWELTVAYEDTQHTLFTVTTPDAGYIVVFIQDLCDAECIQQFLKAEFYDLLEDGCEVVTRSVKNEQTNIEGKQSPVQQTSDTQTD